MNDNHDELGRFSSGAGAIAAHKAAAASQTETASRNLTNKLGADAAASAKQHTEAAAMHAHVQSKGYQFLRSEQNGPVTKTFYHNTPAGKRPMGPDTRGEITLVDKEGSATKFAGSGSTTRTGAGMGYSGSGLSALKNKLP
jgi:hypothetical protein